MQTHLLTIQQAACQQVSLGPVFCMRVPAAQRNTLMQDCVHSYLRHWHELPALPMGSSRKEYKRAKEARRQAAYQIVAKEVAARRGIDISEYCRSDPATNKRYVIEIALLAVLAIFFSPGFILLCIVGACVGWLIESELSRQLGEQTFAAAAAECRDMPETLEKIETAIASLQQPTKRRKGKK